MRNQKTFSTAAYLAIVFSRYVVRQVQSAVIALCRLTLAGHQLLTKPALPSSAGRGEKIK